MEKWNREIRLQECIFDATTVVYGGGALIKQDWWPQDEDSRDVFQKIREIAEFYEEYYPEDDEDYLENIEYLTIAWFKDECGVSLTEEEETYLYKIQRIAQQIRNHIPDGWDKYDYDFWEIFEYILGEQITDTEYQRLNSRIDNPLELDVTERAKVKAMLEEIRHPKKRFKVQLKQYRSACRDVEFEADSMAEAHRIAWNKTTFGDQEWDKVWQNVPVTDEEFGEVEILGIEEIKEG